MGKEKYSYYEEMLEVFQDTEWNDETAFYLLGRLGTLFTTRLITEEEYKKLFPMIPLTQEQMKKVNY